MLDILGDNLHDVYYNLDIKSLVAISCVSKTQYETFEKFTQNLRIPCRISIAGTGNNSSVISLNVTIGYSSHPIRFKFESPSSPYNKFEVISSSIFINIKDIDKPTLFGHEIYPIPTKIHYMFSNDNMCEVFEAEIKGIIGFAVKPFAFSSGIYHNITINTEFGDCSLKQCFDTGQCRAIYRKLPYEYFNLTRCPGCHIPLNDNYTIIINGCSIIPNAVWCSTECSIKSRGFTM